MSLLNLRLLADVQREATRAHDKHGIHSMYYRGACDDRRCSILTEEVGEVARELNDAAYKGLDARRLRAELIQVAAMALTWAQAIDDGQAGQPSESAT